MGEGTARHRERTSILVDDKEQVIVHGLASGVGQDHQQIASVLAGASETLELSGLTEELPWGTPN